jgi:hypothetical protein
MTKAVCRIDRLEPFFGKGLFQIFPADSVNTMTCDSFAPLIDKEAVLIRGTWEYAVFSDIELE